MDKYEAILLLIVGGTITLIFKIIFDWLKGKKEDDKPTVFVCPLDKTGLQEGVRVLGVLIDKQEDKLNKVVAIVDYNKKIIEHVDGHYEKIAEALMRLIGITEKDYKEMEKQTDILQKILTNGNRK